MQSSNRLRQAYGSACLLAAFSLALAGPALAAKPRKAAAKPKTVIVKTVDAPLSPAPSTSPLGHKAIENASAYRAYMDRVARISAGFTTGKQVEDSLMLAAQADAAQLGQGAVSYAAVVALQDPSFVHGVRSAAPDDASRRELVRRIIENPNVATTLPGSNSAAGAISAALGADGSKVAGVGAAVKQAAYDVQRSAWSKAAVPKLSTRLAKAKALAALPMSGSQAEISRVIGAASAYATATPTPVSSEAMPAPSTPVVSRGLAIAALAALGAGGEENAQVVQDLATDPKAGFCLSMSKLNLNQCLSVAKPYYEDVFCLGQHILIDIGQCVADSAGQSRAPAVSVAAGGVAAAGGAYAATAQAGAAR